jgi:hypothetical protein
MPTPRVREPTPYLPVITPTLLLIKEHRVKPPQRHTRQQHERREPALITKPQEHHHAGAG